MIDVRSVLLQGRDRGHQLANQPDGKRDASRPVHGFGQSESRRKRRDDGETVFVSEAFERTDQWECGMSKRRELLHALAQRRFEPLIACECRPEPEDLPRGSTRVVEHQQTIAQTVRMPLGIPRGEVLFAVDWG